MTHEDLFEAALSELAGWYDSERPSPTQEPERYVVCAGLAVLERARQVFPLAHTDYITDKNQVKTGGPFIKAILARYGETRTYASEGGRTTRGTRTAAEHWAARLNALTAVSELDLDKRAELIDRLQGWLVDHVREYFNRKRIEVEIDLEKPAPLIIRDILEVATARGAAGPVAQHLVGAKLAIRYPDLTIENHNYTTADQQLGRSGDFAVGDTIFHVTVAPMPAVIEKCAGNIRQNYRALLLVPDSRLAAARQMADTLEVSHRVGILALESYVGQNLEEIGKYGKVTIASGLRSLMETYNERVLAIETDHSLLLEIPENLR